MFISTRTHLINKVSFDSEKPWPGVNLISESVKDANVFHAAAPEGGESARFFARLAQAVRPGYAEQKGRAPEGRHYLIVPYPAFFNGSELLMRWVLE